MTAKEWFLMMPSPYSEMAIKYSDKRLNQDYPTASFALACMFYWGATEEGFDFWEAIEDNLNALKKYNK